MGVHHSTYDWPERHAHSDFCVLRLRDYDWVYLEAIGRICHHMHGNISEASETKPLDSCTCAMLLISSIHRFAYHAH